ncbi:hypothetical protein SLEP1_g5781 [Rubroshorea leprosula]|uniref:Methyltransferase n=1 Tax=Rubroshorea leprosula TaxID=152421 RepID=A0AAV5I2W2_9ROSI|nr:hypothetical protein SLEP1_g5781 [Rubroshorea leprosula]
MHWDKDGIWLLEVNRMLQAGGYFSWAAQPVYKHEEALEEQWIEMLNLTARLCWNLVKKEGYIAIWQKPFNNICYLSREAGTKPPLCDPNDDVDNVWYIDLKLCITQLPENGFGANVASWPARLETPPDRLQSIQIDAYITRNELFKAESKFWNETIANFVRGLGWKKIRLRNVMDMRASFGGFAAALIENKLDAWVLNVVPVSESNILPVIYERGLLGVMHDWCELFDTYLRTYELLQAAGLFSVERKRFAQWFILWPKKKNLQSSFFPIGAKLCIGRERASFCPLGGWGSGFLAYKGSVGDGRCNMSTIMLEMDRILRPGGHAYVHDSIDVIDELQDIAKSMGWKVHLHETGEGPNSSYRIMVCEKHLLYTRKSQNQNN